jgi:nucleotide-binding universal stress UspA family protein
MHGTYQIVVGIDGSEGSRRALHWALREAAHRAGTVQAVLAWRRLDAEEAGSVIRTEIGDRANAVEILKRAADQAVGVVEPMPPVAWEVIEARAPRALTQAARDADLLVLGSHGNGRMFHAALGSVSEECIRYAACPVVVLPVPHPERAFLPEEPAVAT